VIEGPYDTLNLLARDGIYAERASHYMLSHARPSVTRMDQSNNG